MSTTATPYQSNRPRMSKSSKFWDRHAEGYAKKPVADEAAYQNKLEITRGYLRPDMEVLEFGCGTGSTALTHAPHVKHIRAIDISEKMVAIAERKADAQHVENVTFEQNTIESLVVPMQTYDAVLGLSILHLLEDMDGALAKVHHMLKPGGVFVTSTACIADHMKWFGLIAPIGHFLGLIPFVRIFTKQHLVDSLIAAGFHIDYEWRPAKNKGVFIVAKKSTTDTDGVRG